MKNKSFIIKLKYKVSTNKTEKLRIFGEIFVKFSCIEWKIIYRNKKYQLKEFLDDIAKDYKKNDFISIKLIITNKIVNFSYMFVDCYSLISIVNKSNFHSPKIIDMKFMFLGCNSLISLCDTSNWNTSKVKEMQGLFFKCISLKSLPDISKWNTFMMIIHEVMYHEQIIVLHHH